MTDIWKCLAIRGCSLCIHNFGTLISVFRRLCIVYRISSRIILLHNLCYLIGFRLFEPTTQGNRTLEFGKDEMQHYWISHILNDMRKYAEENGLALTCAALDDAILAHALDEAEAELPEGKVLIFPKAR